MLHMYYGVDENGPLREENPLDIDKSSFRPQLFMDKMLKESSLNELYRQEEKMKKGVVKRIGSAFQGWGQGARGCDRNFSPVCVFMCGLVGA